MTQFYEAETFYSLEKRNKQFRAHEMSATDFYKTYKRSDFDSFDLIRRDFEFLLYEHGKKYFKVWPGVLPTLMDCGFDIPCDVVQLPYPSFEIRLPIGSALKAHGDDVKYIIVSRPDPEKSKSLGIYFCAGELEDFWILPFNKPTVEDAISSQIIQRFETIGISREQLDFENRQILSVVMSVCFLATGGDRIVKPEVLNSDLGKLLECSENKTVIEKLVNRAVRRGKSGFDVGRSEQWDINVIERSAHDNDSDATGRKLQYQHQRRGHFKTVRYGKQWSERKVVFQRQLTVKPELPPKTIERGYAVK
jgi:hypothetical protein